MTATPNKELPPAPTRVSGPLKVGAASLLLAIGGFLTWASFAPLDEGVPLPGSITVETKRKPVQHHTGGIVARVLVKEGDLVTLNQPVIELDMTQNAGQQAMTRSALQGLAAQRDGLRARLPQRRDQLATLQADLDRLAPLVNEDLYPRNRYNEQARQARQMQMELSGDQAQLHQIEAQMREQQERLGILDAEVARSTIRATGTGAVLGLSVTTPGAVIAPGNLLMEIVPQGDKLVIEAQVPPHLIERVRAGLPAEVRFTALDPRKTPVVLGEIVLVSADLVTPANPQIPPHYTARVTVSDAERERLGKVALQPGMPVEVIAITGERSFLTYLFKPITDRMAVSLKER